MISLFFARLSAGWMSASCFSDRLTSEDDQRALFDRLIFATREKLREDLQGALRHDFGEAEEGWSIMAKRILFTELGSRRRVLEEVLPPGREALQQHLQQLLEDFNLTEKR